MYVLCGVLCDASSSCYSLHLGRTNLQNEFAQDYNSAVRADGSVLSAWYMHMHAAKLDAMDLT